MRKDAEAEDKETASRRGGGIAASTSYLRERDAGQQNAAPAAFAHKSTRFAAPRAGGDVKVRLFDLDALLSPTLVTSTHFSHSLTLSLAPLLLPLLPLFKKKKKHKQCLVSYTAGAAYAAKLASKGGRGVGEAKHAAPAAAANRAASAAATATPLDVDVDDEARRRQRHLAAAETTPAPPPQRRRVEWEAQEEEQEELETPLTQQQHYRSRRKRASSQHSYSPAACFLLDLASWRDPPLSLLALSAFSASLFFFALSSSSPLAAWASSAPVSFLISALFEKRSLLTLLCQVALFDLGVSSLRGLVSENFRERGNLSGSRVEAAASAAAAGAVRRLCSLRDAALNPRDPKVALRTAAALLLLLASSSRFSSGGGNGGSGSGGRSGGGGGVVLSILSFGVLKQVFKVAAVSGFYLCFAAGAAWRWWPRNEKKNNSSSSSSRRPPLLLLRPDLDAAASLASRELSAFLSLLATKTGLAALVDLLASFADKKNLSSLSLGTRASLGTLAALVAWRLSPWGARGAALLLLLLFARAHVFGEQASREMARRAAAAAMGHPVLASARKGCAALGSAARERVMARRRRWRRREEEEEEEDEDFFEGEEEEEEEKHGGRAGRGAGASDLYSSRLQAASNDVQQQQQLQFPHSSRNAFRRGGGGGVIR